jgi:NADH:ubiquinone oxidoreductase subunit K
MDPHAISRDDYLFTSHCFIGSSILCFNLMLAIVFIKFYSTFREQTFYVIAWQLIAAEIIIAGGRLSILLILRFRQNIVTETNHTVEMGT